MAMNTDNVAPGHQAQAYLVGGGIAALASAAYLIRDGGFASQDIEILEDPPRLGGSLDGTWPSARCATRHSERRARWRDGRGAPALDPVDR